MTASDSGFVSVLETGTNGVSRYDDNLGSTGDGVVRIVNQTINSFDLELLGVGA